MRRRRRSGFKRRLSATTLRFRGEHVQDDLVDNRRGCRPDVVELDDLALDDEAVAGRSPDVRLKTSPSATLPSIVGKATKLFDTVSWVGAAKPPLAR